MGKNSTILGTHVASIVAAISNFFYELCFRLDMSNDDLKVWSAMHKGPCPSTANTFLLTQGACSDLKSQLVTGRNTCSSHGCWRTNFRLWQHVFFKFLHCSYKWLSSNFQVPSCSTVSLLSLFNVSPSVGEPLLVPSSHYQLDSFTILPNLEKRSVCMWMWWSLAPSGTLRLAVWLVTWLLPATVS